MPSLYPRFIHLRLPNITLITFNLDIEPLDCVFHTKICREKGLKVQLAAADQGFGDEGWLVGSLAYDSG